MRKERLYKTKVTMNGIEVTYFPGKKKEDWFDVEYEHTEEYYIANEWGYVKYTDDRGNSKQICERMASTGNTLCYSSDEKLVKGIRKELKKWAKDVREYC